jgi:hypothetical protein
MTRDHYNALLKVRRKAKPYKVFTIELPGGILCEIDHVDAVATVDSLTRFISPGGVVIWFDHESVIRFTESGRMDSLRSFINDRS